MLGDTEGEIEGVAETDGVIISNDNYRDLVNEDAKWRKVIEERYFSCIRTVVSPDKPKKRL